MELELLAKEFSAKVILLRSTPTLKYNLSLTLVLMVRSVCGNLIVFTPMPALFCKATGGGVKVILKSDEELLPAILSFEST